MFERPIPYPLHHSHTLQHGNDTLKRVYKKCYVLQDYIIYSSYHSYIHERTTTHIPRLIRSTGISVVVAVFPVKLRVAKVSVADFEVLCPASIQMQFKIFNPQKILWVGCIKHQVVVHSQLKNHLQSIVVRASVT